MSPEARRTPKVQENLPNELKSFLDLSEPITFEQKSALREAPGGPQRGLKSDKTRIKMKVVFQKVFERRLYRFWESFLASSRPYKCGFRKEGIANIDEIKSPYPLRRASNHIPLPLNGTSTC